MEATTRTSVQADQGDRSAGGERSKTVLIVDDEEDILVSLKHLLESARSVQVLPAGSARAGLANMSENEVDCVVTDYRMPGMNGVEFLREVFRLRPGAPAIMVTAFQDAEAELRQALGNAKVAVLWKPLDIPAFLAALDGLLSHRTA